MDILAHGLWTAAAAKALNKSSRQLLNIKWATFWGVFPDLAAFTPLFIWLFWKLIFGGRSFFCFGEAACAASSRMLPPMALENLTKNLYKFSHSLIIFLAVFILAYLILRRPRWELGGWLLHILIDIPTHSTHFYPTPFLWPIASVRFNGYSWAHPWFLGVNYLAIIIVYVIFWRKKDTSHDQV